MLKAIIKNGTIALLLTILMGLLGCSAPEEKRAKELVQAREFAASGLSEQAIKILEELAAEYPNDPEILTAIGRIYSAEEDHAMAAFFLQQAYQQSQDNVELLLQTYQALHAAGQPSGQSLNKLSELSPESMTDELWIRLGQYHAANNQNESALQAYLKGADLEKRKPSPEVAAAIGQLFSRVDNLPQSELWLKVAADNDDPNAITALFDLLEIQLRQKRWSDSEATIARLDEQFPGAVDASQYAQTRQELKRWRTARKAMKVTLSEAAAKKETEEAANAAEQGIELIEKEEIERPAMAETDGGSGGKAQAITDMEAAEAMANQPAIENEEGAEGLSATFDPETAVESGARDLSPALNSEQEPLASRTRNELRSPDQVAGGEPESPMAGAPESFAPNIGPATSGSPRTLEEILAEAETAEIDRDFKAAIRNYWIAINMTESRADIWNLLSRAYLIDGQRENAEVAALEAIRMEPDEVAYTLDYLRVAQRSETPDQFLSYLETAFDRFPASPEITLSLARAYERIKKDRPAARSLYQRFIDIAPGHPLVPEARDAIERLR